MNNICGDPKPHKAHRYRKISDGWHDCPGHDRPFVPAPIPCDACEGMAHLCPKHASVDRLIEALGALTCAAEPLIALYLDEWEPGLGDLIEPAKAARALLDELKQAQGTQTPETT